MHPSRIAAVAACGALAALLAGAPAGAADIKYATYVPPQHGVAKFLEATLRGVAARSHGAMSLTYLPSGQMGPPPKYYGMAHSGQVDISWFLHGNTPGRFPLSEIGTVPLLFGSAEIGTKSLNDKVLLDKYLKKEHRGLHILNLHTHQPANVYTASKPIRRVEDFKGKRLRVPSGPIRDLAIALGATPDGTPPTQWAEALQKGTIDGVFTDYGGAGIAFRIGPVTKFATELYVYVGTFCLCMNEKSYERLPAAVRKDLDDSFAAHVAQSGVEFDKLDDIGKKLMMSQGTQPIILPPADLQRVRAVAADIADGVVKAVEKKGLPGREVYALMQQLAKKNEKTSRNFWAQ